MCALIHSQHNQEGKMLKISTLLIICFFAHSAYAGPYIMTKHEFKSKDSEYNATVNQFRFGYDQQIDDWNLYGEVGGGESLPNSTSLGSGTSLLSYEFGATKKINDKFSIKMKWEGKDHTDSYLEHKFQIKTKYRF